MVSAPVKTNEWSMAQQVRSVDDLEPWIFSNKIYISMMKTKLSASTHNKTQLDSSRNKKKVARAQTSLYAESNFRLFTAAGQPVSTQANPNSKISYIVVIGIVIAFVVAISTAILVAALVVSSRYHKISTLSLPFQKMENGQKNQVKTLCQKT